ncbi:helicase HerA-like domain-containing protein [uncultured Devosia sp.]|uniref:helicase HerA-like domain-containing protein n=1 Tax=uncultured Devosia sp. TaxID=211434 RepID=UPI0035CBB970
MLVDDKVYLGTSTRPEYLALRYGNRHGLITGATGTGKTVTLQIMAEGFSRAGVPVFCADVKGDLSGIAMTGTAQDFLVKRAADIGMDDYAVTAFPTMFWDLFGRQGHPIRTTISEMGPLLLSRMLELNDTQEGVLNIAFKLADDEGLLLLDLKDLRALLVDIGQRADAVSATYGNVATASIGAVQRALLVLEQQGGENFFGERALDIADLMRTDRDGRGFVSVLAADELMRAPRLYATFLLWLLSELFEDLPEVGDPDKPRLVFFFDEAHLLFDGAPKALVDKVEQVVKLVRSKGVGVYFVTQNPVDVPEAVLAQLSNRVQHALRAYTPREQKAVRVAAETFRPNPDFSTEEVITQLGTGEALVSVIEDKGIPSIVGRTLIRPPSSRLGPILPEERRAILANSPVAGLYDTVVDRDSAFEVLAKKSMAKQAAEEQQRLDDERAKADQKERAERTYQDGRPPARRASTRQSPAEAAMNSLARTVANRLGSALVRGILGSLKRGR